MNLAALSTLITALTLAACGIHTSRPEWPQARIAIVGDTQRTSLAERMIGREQNDPERLTLIKHIAAERADLLIHLGDMVFDGSSPSEWQRFDRLVEGITDQGVRMLAVLGNHEYWGAADSGIDLALRRFPEFRRSRWYLVRFQSLGLIVLDSNREALGEARWSEQGQWYARALRELERDRSIRGVLVLVHHPPYTNSTVTSDDLEVQESFLPAFHASAKTLAMISGHSHTYERFIEKGKHFIVSGGGGGPRVKLLEGSERRHEDLFEGTSPRPFHYLLLLPEAPGVRVRVKGFAKGAQALRQIDEFLLPFPE